MITASRTGCPVVEGLQVSVDDPAVAPGMAIRDGLNHGAEQDQGADQEGREDGSGHDLELTYFRPA